MHRRSRSLAVLAILLAGGTAQAEPSAYCQRVSKKPEGKSGYAVVTLDANSGRLVDGPTRLSEGDRVQFIFEGKNPFKYDYRFAVTSQPLGTALALKFLGMIPGLNLGDLVATVPPGITALAVVHCTTAGEQQWQQEILKKISAAEKRSPDVAQSLHYLDVANAFLEATKPDALPDLAQICESAEKLKAWPHAPQMPDAFKQEVDAIDALLLRPTDNGGQLLNANCKIDVTTRTQQAMNALKADAARYQAAAATTEPALATSSASIQQLDALLTSTLGREDLFYETRFVSASDEPTGVRVELFRRDLRNADSPERSVGSLDMELGKSPFSLTAGVVLSTIESRRLVRQPARVPTEGNPNQVGLRFGYDEDSAVTIAPAVFLNARLSDNPRYNWGASAGIVTAAADSTLRIDYALGLFTSFRDVFYLHLGLQAGQRSSLAGGFKEGEEVPADLPDPIPTTKNWKVGLLFGFSLQLN
ncbi:hypothetical protein [Corallococcus exiguus]|uniref:hypothetical protein n=1 Tax=Corallococcus exiguus TaxID=83462 RepID=UPI001493EAA2|nr:hypothetical protein [Corallococcus exiguus]NPC74169.1 hypothetical protein [Corallococcus exiguus]NPD25906.1 hypothetical protein [Corallococcus exiguus]